MWRSVSCYSRHLQHIAYCHFSPAEIINAAISSLASMHISVTEMIVETFTKPERFACLPASKHNVSLPQQTWKHFHESLMVAVGKNYMTKVKTDHETTPADSFRDWSSFSIVNCESATGSLASFSFIVHSNNPIASGIHKVLICLSFSPWRTHLSLHVKQTDSVWLHFLLEYGIYLNVLEHNWVGETFTESLAAVWTRTGVLLKVKCITFSWWK